MDFAIGDRVKARLAGGQMWPGVIVGKTMQKDPMLMTWDTSYLVQLDDWGSTEYFKEVDLVIEPKDTYNWAAYCVCGATKTYAPKEPPGHAYFCDLEKNRILIEGNKK